MTRRPPPPPRLGPSPDAARLAETLARFDPTRVVVVLGDDLAASVSRGLVAFAEAGGFPVWGTQLTSRAAFPVHPSLLGRRAQARLRAHARAFRERRGDRAGRRPGLRRLPLSLRRAGARGRRGPACRRQRRRPSGASTPPTWRCSATSARRSRPRPSGCRTGRPQGGRGASRRRAHGQEAAHAALRAAILDETGRPLSPDAAVLAALDALPPDALIANDSAATFGKVQDLLVTRPGRYFFSRGGVLGCNMPAAVGAALAGAGLVASFVGDGGAMYSPRPCGAPRIIGPRSSSSSSTTAATGCCRTSRRASATPTRSPGGSSAWRSRPGDRLPGARVLDGRAAAARRRPRGDRRGGRSRAPARRPLADRDRHRIALLSAPPLREPPLARRCGSPAAGRLDRRQSRTPRVRCEGGSSVCAYQSTNCMTPPSWTAE